LEPQATLGVWACLVGSLRPGIRQFSSSSDWKTVVPADRHRHQRSPRDRKTSWREEISSRYSQAHWKPSLRACWLRFPFHLQFFELNWAALMMFRASVPWSKSRRPTTGISSSGKGRGGEESRRRVSRMFEILPFTSSEISVWEKGPPLACHAGSLLVGRGKVVLWI